MIDKAEKTETVETEDNDSEGAFEDERLISTSLIQDHDILFTADELTITDVRKIRRGVRYSPQKIKKFKERLKAEKPSSRKNPKKSERAGLGWWILNEHEKARKQFEKSGTDLSLCFCVLCIKEEEGSRSALEYIDSLSSKEAAGKNVMTMKALLLFQLTDIDTGMPIVKKLAKKYSEDNEVKKLRAMYAEETGEPQTALDLYQEILKNEPADEEALFYCAQLLDRFGIEKQALRYYERVANIFPARINAVLNLGQKYYEISENEKAAFCFKRVLKLNPAHNNARRFLHDIKATDNMYYDEKKAKRKEELNKILQVPVSDFELSVRSRNCLSRMNIRTLGDLIKKTESDLLSYKNFGETSLAEIKRMLASKGLYLGQAKDMQNQELKEKHKRKLIDVTDNELLEKSVEDLELSVRAGKCLEKLDIKTFGDIIKNTEQELLHVRNFGQTSLNEIKQKLASYGLSLKTR